MPRTPMCSGGPCCGGAMPSLPSHNASAADCAHSNYSGVCLVQSTLKPTTVHQGSGRPLKLALLTLGDSGYPPLPLVSFSAREACRSHASARLYRPGTLLRIEHRFQAKNTAFPSGIRVAEVAIVHPASSQALAAQHEQELRRHADAFRIARGGAEERSRKWWRIRSARKPASKRGVPIEVRGVEPQEGSSFLRRCLWSPDSWSS